MRGDLEKELEAAWQKLVVARICMEDAGFWRNDAGYLTDAALWIDKADGDLTRGLALIDRAPSSDQGKDGWVLVPREPTDEMVGAFESKAYLDGGTAVATSTAAMKKRVITARIKIGYRAMISAAPPLSKEAPKINSGSGAEERPSRGSPTDSQTSGGEA